MFIDSLKSEKIRVLVVESTPMASSLLADALGQDVSVEVVGAKSAAGESLQAAIEMRPNVALVCDVLDGQPRRGFELVREIEAACPQVRVVMLLDCTRAELVVEAFRAGAKGVFSRNDSLTALSQCVLNVGRGEICASHEQLGFVLEALCRSSARPGVSAEDLGALSKREREVVRALAEGLSNPEIAELMGLSRHTVKNHIFRIFEKLGVSNRFELMAALNRRRQREHSTTPRRVASHQELEGALTAAAESGVASAQFVLGQMYLNGQRVRQDKVLAYKWLLLAEKSNQTFSEASRVSRKQLATEMLQSQIAEAERLASQWAGPGGNETYFEAAPIASAMVAGMA